MDWTEVPLGVRAILIVAAAAVAWMSIRFVLRITMRLFALGCLGLAVLVVIGGIAGWLG
jgi:hypothetical protein